jgi:hypothetical protein
MVVVAAANVLFTTWATVIDTRRFSAVALLGMLATVAALTAAPRQHRHAPARSTDPPSRDDLTRRRVGGRGWVRTTAG